MNILLAKETSHHVFENANVGGRRRVKQPTMITLIIFIFLSSFKSLESCWQKHCLKIDTMLELFLPVICLWLNSDDITHCHRDVSCYNNSVLHATSLWWVPLSPFQHQYWSGCGPNNPGATVVIFGGSRRPFLGPGWERNINNNNNLMLNQQSPSPQVWAQDGIDWCKWHLNVKASKWFESLFIDICHSLGKRPSFSPLSRNLAAKQGLADCPTRWSLWYWYLDFYVDTQMTEKYSTAMCDHPPPLCHGR